MDTESQRPTSKDGLLSSLNASIDSMNVAKGVPRISPVVSVFASVGGLLTTIKVRPPLSGDLFQAKI